LKAGRPITPISALAQLGVSDIPALAAVLYLLIVQIAFLATLIHNFLLFPQGNEFVDVTPRAVGLAATVLIPLGALWQARRTWRRLKVSAALERPARNLLYSSVQGLLSTVLKRSEVQRDVELCYHMVNAEACHVTEGLRGPDRIVVGVNKAVSATQQPRLLESLLAHEVSHLEHRRTRVETWARAGLLIYVQSAAAVLVTIVLLVGYLEPEVRDDGTAIAGVLPHWNPDLQSRFVIPIVIQTLVSMMIVGLSYFVLIRRELLHDLRATQLVGHRSLLTERFEPECKLRQARTGLQRLGESWSEIRGIHPSVCQRARVLTTEDWVTLDSGVYPLIAGLLLTTPLLLLGPVLQALDVPKVPSNVIATLAGAWLIYCVTRADVGRFAALHLTRQAWIMAWVRYCCTMAASSTFVGLLLGLWYGIRRLGGGALTVVIEAQFERCISLLIFLMVLLFGLQMLVALWRLADAESAVSRRTRVFRECLVFLVILGAFTAPSLSLAPAQILVYTMTVVLFCIPLLIALSSRCRRCASYRLGALLLLKPVCRRCAYHYSIAPIF
jgi:hypothetical protein